MKIAFWSNVRKKGAVSTNMVCMAAVTAIAGMGRSVLLENHYNINNLGGMLLAPEQTALLRENGQYFNKYGIEYMLKRLYTGEPGEVLLRKAAIPLLYSSIYYLPQSYIVNKEVFNYEFELVHEDLFRCLERFSDLVFIDTQSHGNASTIEILQEADLIVVNIDQDIKAWEDYFENYQSLIEKSVFLIGRYQKEYAWNVSKLRRRFHVEREQIGVIPYNMELQSAIQEGRILQFLNRNYMRNVHAENNYLMREMKRSAVMLRENMIQTGKMKIIRKKNEL
jgi:hypothetical protein